MKLFLSVISVFLVIIASVTDIQAQQDPQYSQYMYNTMSVNPAYAGSKDFGVITAIGRMQWVGFEGAPETQNLSYHTPLGYSGLGLGFNIMNDKIGPSQEISLDANASYSIQTDLDGTLAFGLRLGGRFLNIDWSKGTANDDEAIFGENVSKFLPTIGAGVYYHKPTWYIGLSVPNILKMEHYDGDNQLGKTAVEKMHFFFIAGAVYDINYDLMFKPAVLLKAVAGAPLSLDISGNFLYKEKFRAGLAWRWDDAISALLGFQASETLLIGYSYDLTTSNYNVTNSGTHEIMLQYELSKGSKYKVPKFF
ncbi:type IX secretion system membrane protein PorP/SprF [Tenacibaculum piscium]|uniref:PorP/SprF family type IX secretion system membrane protein n=1 Tax=Tenacibaculum piscium TaxID=1458515 RepID=UPI001EFB3173|nr:type IX secretion system membrane protein PorP/SprF [Tenacibaculum piscium]MCG8182557.1 type IX secretion system membrane protein PorP/SprF [Tenacibaculum piscium]MCG8203949.1 type IX secretion system membrane protein PorP/SprF [Tenacibaculum piscium]